MYAKGGNLLLSFLLLGVLGCKANTSVAEKTAGGACPLLSAAEVQAVQGEKVSEMKGSERTSDSLSTAQCFYRLPTFSKSVSLEVTRPVGSSTRAAEEFWERRFGAGREAEEREMEAEREMEKKRSGEKGERKEEVGARRRGVGVKTSTRCWSGRRCFLEWQPAQFFTLPPKK